MRRTLAFASIVVLAGCGVAPGSDGFMPEGPVGRSIAAAADAHRVPRDLVAAMAHVEGGLKLGAARAPDEEDLVHVAGALELRRGAFDSLGRGAELAGRSARDLEIDWDLGTDAGAAVLADVAKELHVAEADLSSWAPVVERMSGYLDRAAREDYRARVFAVLREGGALPARRGEVLALAPHPDVPFFLAHVAPRAQTLGNPEYPGAIWFDTDCTDKCNTYREAAVSMIAIHDTEGGWDASVATLQFDAGKSVHYIVDADGGQVGQFIPEAWTGWHVANHYYNHRMVGIEHVGYAAEDAYETAMYEKSADLVKAIAGRYGVPLDRAHIVAHQEVPDGVNVPQDAPPCPDSPGACIASGDYGGSGHHDDPGVNWEWCQYMELVGGTCKCNDAFDLWNCVHDGSEMVRCPNGTVELVHCADACVVEPNGTDDHCTPVVDDTSAATGGLDVSAATGAQGAGGAGGGALGDTPAASASAGCSCSATGGSTDPGAVLGIAAIGLAAIGRRRRRGHLCRC